MKSVFLVSTLLTLSLSSTFAVDPQEYEANYLAEGSKTQPLTDRGFDNRTLMILQAQEATMLRLERERAERAKGFADLFRSNSQTSPSGDIGSGDNRTIDQIRNMDDRDLVSYSNHVRAKLLDSLKALDRNSALAKALGAHDIESLSQRVSLLEKVDQYQRQYTRSARVYAERVSSPDNMARLAWADRISFSVLEDNDRGLTAIQKAKRKLTRLRNQANAQTSDKPINRRKNSKVGGGLGIVGGLFLTFISDDVSAEEIEANFGEEFYFLED